MPESLVGSNDLAAAENHVDMKPTAEHLMQMGLGYPRKLQDGKIYNTSIYLSIYLSIYISFNLFMGLGYPRKLQRYSFIYYLSINIKRLSWLPVFFGKD